MVDGMLILKLPKDGIILYRLVIINIFLFLIPVLIFEILRVAYLSPEFCIF